MRIRNFKQIALALLACLSFASCKKTVGYSVVLWGNEKNQLNNGEVVKVLVKSNITHTYIIENPKTNGKEEIPL